MKTDSDSQCLSFTPPKGFSLPEGAAPGKSFDIVCTFEVDEDGKLELTKIGDTELPDDDEKDEEGAKPESKPDYSHYADSAAGADSGMGA